MTTAERMASSQSTIGLRFFCFAFLASFRLFPPGEEALGFAYDPLFPFFPRHGSAVCHSILRREDNTHLESLTSDFTLPIILPCRKRTGRRRIQTQTKYPFTSNPSWGCALAVYLTGLYGVIAVLLIFFLFFYPGLRNRGSYLSLTTSPDHATVKVDGVYAGSTPCVVFLRHGRRSVEISRPFYSKVSFEETVGGRVFGTLFVPDSHGKSQSLTVADVEGLLGWAREDFQRNPGIPSILSDAADAASAGSPSEKWYDFINDSMLFVTNEFQLKELLHATAKVASSGVDPDSCFICERNPEFDTT